MNPDLSGLFLLTPLYPRKLEMELRKLYEFKSSRDRKEEEGQGDEVPFCSFRLDGSDRVVCGPQWDERIYRDKAGSNPEGPHNFLPVRALSSAQASWRNRLN